MPVVSELGWGRGHAIGVLLRGAVLKLTFDGTSKQRSSCFGHLGCTERTHTLKGFSENVE